MSSYQAKALSVRSNATGVSITVVRGYWWLFVAVAVVLFAPVALHPANHYLGNLGDPQQTLWFLHWFWYAILHGQNPFISRMMNYPNGVDLMSNSADPAEAFLFGPLFYLVNDNFAYNAILFVNLCVSGIFGALILQELGVRNWLAALGGAMFEILPYTSAQINGHANLTVTAWLLGVTFMFLRVTNNKFARPALAGAFTGLLFAGEFYTSLEITATFTAAVLTGLACGLLLARRDTVNLCRRIPLRYLASALVVAAALCLPGLFYFKYGAYSPGGMHIVPGGFPVAFSNDVLTYIVPTPIYRLHTTWTGGITAHFAGNYAEQDGYIGIVAITLLTWAAITTWHKGLTRVAVPLILWVCVLSLGVFLHVLGRDTFIPMPWAILALLPLYSQAVPGRLMFYTDVLTVILVIRAAEQYLYRRDVLRPWPGVTGIGKGTRWPIGLMVALAAWVATWWPVAPVASAEVASLSAVEPGGPLYSDLAGHPTLILSDDFFQVLQGLEHGGYAFPVANVYGFQNNTPAEAAYRPEALGWVSELSGQDLSNFLASMVASTQVTRVAYVPIYGGANSAPPGLFSAMTELYGPPRVDRATGDAIWAVPAKPPAVWVEGDVTNPEALFEGPAALPSALAGPWFVVTTRRKGCEVTFTAPTDEFIQFSGAKTGRLHLIAGQRASLLIPANTAVSFQVGTSPAPNSATGVIGDSSVEVHLSPR